MLQYYESSKEKGYVFIKTLYFKFLKEMIKKKKLSNFDWEAYHYKLMHGTH